MTLALDSSIQFLQRKLKIINNKNKIKNIYSTKTGLWILNKFGLFIITTRNPKDNSWRPGLVPSQSTKWCSKPTEIRGVTVIVIVIVIVVVVIIIIIITLTLITIIIIMFGSQTKLV
jgi:archaellum biogenesis protein FlaJ (TadC family)